MAPSFEPFPACSVCSFLGRSCGNGCRFAIFFPMRKYMKFASVQLVFGVDFLIKVFEKVPPNILKLTAAVDLITKETQARLLNPVYGMPGELPMHQNKVEEELEDLDDLDDLGSYIFSFCRTSNPSSVDPNDLLIKPFQNDLLVHSLQNLGRTDNSIVVHQRHIFSSTPNSGGFTGSHAGISSGETQQPPDTLPKHGGETTPAPTGPHEITEPPGGGVEGNIPRASSRRNACPISSRTTRQIKLVG